MLSGRSRFGPHDLKQELRMKHAQVTIRGISQKGGLVPVTSMQSPGHRKTFTVDVMRNATGLYA